MDERSALLLPLRVCGLPLLPWPCFPGPASPALLLTAGSSLRPLSLSAGRIPCMDRQRSSTPPDTPPAPAPTLQEPQLILDFGPPPPPCFDNFVPGPNLECAATLRHLVHTLQQGETPAQRFFYVWGPAGSGKSHLASALTASQAPNLTVVDDVDQYSKGRQRTLFHRFNALVEQPEQALVVFGNQPPARLKLLPELVSRLGWGMVFALQPLNDTALVDALEHTARERGLTLGQDLSTYLLRHTRRDMASLKTILDGLEQLARARKKQLTLPLLKDYLQRREQGGG